MPKIIEWSDQYSVGVKLIDEQHKQFVGILNNVYQALVSENSKTTINGLIDELVSYANTHFKTEEQYFDQFDYEGADEHKTEHTRLLDQVNVFLQRKELESDMKYFGFELLEFLEDWLVNHLNNMDKKYTKCFNDHGLF